MLVLAMHQCTRTDVQSEGDQPRLEEKKKKTKERKKKEKEKEREKCNDRVEKRVNESEVIRHSYVSKTLQRQPPTGYCGIK